MSASGADRPKARSIGMAFYAYDTERGERDDEIRARNRACPGSLLAISCSGFGLLLGDWSSLDVSLVGSPPNWTKSRTFLLRFRLAV